MAIVSTPITLESVSNIVLERTTTNAGDIFDKSKINKWSKRKPIRHPETIKLSDVQLQGDETDRNNGIYYGLKVSSNSTMLKDLHEADWSYASFPTGGIGTAPFRMWDFVGYDTNAKPTLRGSGIATTVYYNVTNVFGVILDWNLTNNTTGVDIGEIFQGLGYGSIAYGDLYMCVLIDGYATAMINSRVAATAGTNFAPILYNGTYCDTFTCPPLKEQNIMQSEATRKVTILITDYIHAQPLMGSWKYVLNDAFYSGVYVSIPDLAGLSVKFVSSTTPTEYGAFNITGLTQLSNTVTLQATCITAPSVAGYYRVSVIIDGRYTITGEFSMMANNKNFISPRLTLPTGLNPGSYRYDAVIYRLSGSGGSIISSVGVKSNGSITITLY